MALLTETSQAVSKYLNSIEMSSEHVASRVSMFRRLEVLARVVDYQEEFQPTFITGSTMDGVYWKNYMADLDTMNLFSCVHVTDDIPSNENTDDWVFEIVQEDVHPGYVRLKLHSEGTSDNSIFTKTFGGVKSYCTKIGNDAYLSAYKFKRAFNRYQLVHEKSAWVFQTAYNYAIDWPDEEEILEHGPSLCFSDQSKDEMPNDSVPCFSCPKWPKQAQEWIFRKRGDWPSTSLIKNIVEKGCKVVPVGFAGSSSKDIEWRLSFALCEQELVRSFNITHYKCYALLKMLLKEAIDIQVPDVLTSFYMKNTLLWTIEQTKISESNEDEILSVFLLCLNNLHSWIKSGHCPSYFIPSNNVFDHKLAADDRGKVEALLLEFIQEGWQCLRRCPSMSDFFLEYDKSKTARDIEFEQQLRESIWFEHDMRLFPRFEHARVELMTCLDTSDDTSEAIVNHHETFQKIETRTQDSFYRMVLEPLVHAIESSLGSHYHALAIHFADENPQRKELLNLAEEYLLKGKNSDVASGKLKLASFYYQNKKYDKCLSLVNDVIGNNHMVPTFVPQFLPKRNDPKEEKVHQFKSFVENSDLPLEERFLQTSAQAVIFLPSEISSAPDAVKFQLQKPQIDPLDYVRWLRWAIYDVDVFAHYLRVVCFLAQDDHETALQSLKQIESLVENDDVGYRTPALNIIGYCYVSMHDLKNGVKYLLKAMEEDIMPQSMVWQLSGAVSHLTKSPPSFLSQL